MKEENLKGHKKYANILFSKMENHMEQVTEETKEEFRHQNKNYKYRCKFLNNENELSGIGNCFSDNTYYYFTNKKDIEKLFKYRDDFEPILFNLLLKLYYEDSERLKSDIIRRVSVLSSTNRYIQKISITPTHDMKECIISLFKYISEYRLHCRCQYKIVNRSLVIQLLHSQKQIEKSNSKRKAKEEVK